MVLEVLPATLNVEATAFPPKGVERHFGAAWAVLLRSHADLAGAYDGPLEADRPPGSIGGQALPTT
eukprot:4186234-Alexandrium_andersonii.AAC.1